MAADSRAVAEPDFYREVTGREHPGEYGERLAARRRETKYQANLHANDSSLLRQALAPLFGLDPAGMHVVDYNQHVLGRPGAPNAIRLRRTRNVLADLAAGGPVPDLLVAPQLRIATGHGPGRGVAVTPAFLVRDPDTDMYVVGAARSLTLRDNVADEGALELPRREAAAGVLALAGEAVRHGVDGRHEDRAVFVYSTPYGLKPAPPRIEPLGAELHAARRAVDAYAVAAARLDALRREPGQHEAPLASLTDDLGREYAETCLGRCILADHCRAEHRDDAVALGDAAARALDGVPPDGLAAVLTGAAGASPARRELADRVADAAAAIGLDVPELLRRLA